MISELIWYVCLFLQRHDLFARCACVSKEWKELVYKAWQKYVLDQGIIGREEMIFFYQEYGRDWKWLLKSRKNPIRNIIQSCSGSIEHVNDTGWAHGCSKSNPYKYFVPIENFRLEGDWKCNLADENLVGQIFLFGTSIVLRGFFCTCKWPHLNLRLNGMGMCIYENGDWYKGNWKKGRKEGYGIYVWNEPREWYIGWWKRGIRHGPGEYIFLDKSVYKGTFLFDRPCDYKGSKEIQKTKQLNNNCLVDGIERITPEFTICLEMMSV